jgi:hypothetical protein
LDSVQKFLNDALYHRHVENAFSQAAAPLVLRLLCSSCTSMDRQAMIACLSQAHSHLSNTIEDVPPSQINSAMSVKKAVVLLHASMHDQCVAVSVRSWRENTHVVQEQCGRHARGSSRAARRHQQQQQSPQQAIANTLCRLRHDCVRLTACRFAMVNTMTLVRQRVVESATGATLPHFFPVASVVVYRF